MKTLIKKQFMATILTGILIFCNCLNVSAVELEDDSSLDISNIVSSLENPEDVVSSETTEFATVLEELEEINIDEKSSSNLEENKLEHHNIKDALTISGNQARDIGDNTNPNYAITLQLGDVAQGNISAANEIRWYNFELETKSKIQFILQMVDALDSDFYVYQLDATTGTLNLIGGSETAGLGIEEWTYGILNQGIYYIAISGFEGVGNFALALYGTSYDVANEINDTTVSATPINMSENINAVIDNPRDLDYYKINLEKRSVISYKLTNPSGGNYEMVYANGSGGQNLRKKDNIVILNPGMHYFLVRSTDGTYSKDNPYSTTINFHANIANDTTAVNFVYSEEANVFFQFNSNKTAYYVNGNPIDFSYKYNFHSSNSAGSQDVDIELIKTPNFQVCLTQKEGMDVSPELQQTIPDIVQYKSNWPNAKVGAWKPMLRLSVNDWNNKCYFLHALSSGDYYPDRLYADLHNVNIIINPDTGKVADIDWFNYYYEVGNFTSYALYSYKVNYNYGYYNGTEPIPEGGK